MSVVPLSFQLASWVPAWWRGAVGGDDILELVGAEALPTLRALGATTTATTAFCPDAGVDLLPGPRDTTEAAVSAGEALILHGEPGERSTLLIPEYGGWRITEADPPRPPDLDLRAAEVELAEAVLAAEQHIRESGTDLAGLAATTRKATLRPLPPDADPARQRLLVRSVRIWNACTAIAPGRRGALIDGVVRAAARATLAAYCDLEVTTSRARQRRFA